MTCPKCAHCAHQKEYSDLLRAYQDLETEAMAEGFDYPDQGYRDRTGKAIRRGVPNDKLIVYQARLSESAQTIESHPLHTPGDLESIETVLAAQTTSPEDSETLQAKDRLLTLIQIVLDNGGRIELQASKEADPILNKKIGFLASVPVLEGSNLHQLIRCDGPELIVNATHLVGA